MQPRVAIEGPASLCTAMIAICDALIREGITVEKYPLQRHVMLLGVHTTIEAPASKTDEARGDNSLTASPSVIIRAVFQRSPEFLRDRFGKVSSVPVLGIPQLEEL